MYEIVIESSTNDMNITSENIQEKKACSLGWAQIQIVDGIKRIHSSWAGGGHPEHFEPNYRSVAYSTKQHTASKVLASQY